MTGFKVDYNEAQDFGAVPDGDYEVVIFNVSEDASKGGTEFINFDMVIRNDVQQPKGNSHLFHKVWKSKETGKYNRGMIMSLAKAFGLQDGKEYASFDQFLQDFAMRTAKVRVKNETSEYNGKTYENTNIKKIEQTQFSNLQHQWKTKDNAPAQSNQSTTISNDSLPF